MYLEIIEILLRGFCVGVAASITVGPVAVLCIQRTLSKSRRSGIVSGLGVAAADTLMAMIAYFCYSMLQAQIDQYNQLLRVVAGIFVVIVGVYIFFQNPVPQIRRNRAGKTSLTQDFASIFGLTIANFVLVIPYILTFFAVFKISTIETFDVARPGTGISRHRRILRRRYPLVDLPGFPDQPFPAPLPSPPHAHDQPCGRHYYRSTRRLYDFIHLLQPHPPWNAPSLKRSS